MTRDERIEQYLELPQSSIGNGVFFCVLRDRRCRDERVFVFVDQKFQKDAETDIHQSGGVSDATKGCCFRLGRVA